MGKLIGQKLKYSSPAVAPKGIHLSWIYTLKKDRRGYYVDDGNFELAMELDLIQQLFTPTENSWQEISK
jgi:hypothetical protein